MTEPWVLYAGIAVWLGLGMYAAMLAAGQIGLKRRVEQLELMLRRRDG